MTPRTSPATQQSKLIKFNEIHESRKFYVAKEFIEAKTTLSELLKKHNLDPNTVDDLKKYFFENVELLRFNSHLHESRIKDLIDENKRLQYALFMAFEKNLHPSASSDNWIKLYHDVY